MTRQSFVSALTGGLTALALEQAAGCASPATRPPLAEAVDLGAGEPDTALVVSLTGPMARHD